ncbi:MAG: glycerol dehydrogenase [Solirubrobacteraceae bacterium]
MAERYVAQALIAPRKYIRGRGLLSSIGKYVQELGRDALVIADESVWGLVREQVEQSFAKAGVRLIEQTFGGECSKREIERLRGFAQREGASVIVGVGGGKAMDTAKAVGYEAALTWASVPTIVSTDTPTSALSVIYTDDGVFEEYMLLPRNPDLVLVDTQIAANAPVQFFVAGMGDALATWVEARAAAEGRKTAMAGGTPTMAALALAKLSWDTPFSYGLSAKHAVERHVVTPAVEKVVEANTLLSGLGFESGGLAAAHAVHNGLTALPATHDYMHGEKVNFGTLTQLALEERPTAEIDHFIAFCNRVGLATTLEEVGLGDADRADLMIAANSATVPSETIHNMPFSVDAEIVCDAMIAADAYGRAFCEAPYDSVATT